MNVKDRLKEAYENISLNADRTWSWCPNAYQRCNLELYLKEFNITTNTLKRNRPRTVRECIPLSRLARYGNYFYNEAREMSYTSNTISCKINVAAEIPNEPWEMPEVSDLCRWFLKNEEFQLNKFEGKFESPLLKVSGFEEKILKIYVTEDRVKNIWTKEKYYYGDSYIKTGEISIDLHRTPLKNTYLFNSEKHINQEWFRFISVTKDLEDLNQLSKSFKIETESIAKVLNGVEIFSPVEPISTEILYSEVLQGVSPSRRCFKNESRGPMSDEVLAGSRDGIATYTVLNSKRTEDFPQQNNQKVIVTTAPTSDKFVLAKTANICMPGDSQHQILCKFATNQFQVDSVQRQSKTVIHPITSNYVQQPHFYPSVQSIQRWIPSNYSSYYPTQVFMSNFYHQNPLMSNVNRLVGPFLSENRDSSDVLNRRVLQTETTLFKENTPSVAVPFVKDHLPSISTSEELEIQALEQYSNSNENFYQELEKQAEEQYVSTPE